MFNHQEEDSSCAAAYCRALLAQLANPFAMSGRQMEFLTRWIEKWSAQLSFALQPLPASAIPSLGINLAGSAGPVFAEGLNPAASLRYLDLEQISRTLRQVITLLKQGQTPAELGLGDDARQPGCENLLMLLYIQWCRAGTSRGKERGLTRDRAQVCLGMHAAHFYISGRSFRVPGSSLSRQEEHDLAIAPTTCSHRAKARRSSHGNSLTKVIQALCACCATLMRKCASVTTSSSRCDAARVNRFTSGSCNGCASMKIMNFSSACANSPGLRAQLRCAR